MRKIYGLIGYPLGHSFSPQIHRLIGGYEYSLFPIEADEVGAFLKAKEFDGINVTIPYKQAVMPYLDRISPEALEVGSVNTVVKEKDGSLSGYNTDIYGFEKMLEKGGIEVADRRVLVLGSGGSSKSVVYVLKKLGARSVTVISRGGEDNYENLEKHVDAEIIVNTTPLGMFPKIGVSAVELSRFPRLTGAIDLIYNPEKTEFLLQAERLGVKCVGGLYMLVAQAARAAELFTGEGIDLQKTEQAYTKLDGQMRNIVLVGMPGCGKSTVGRELGHLLCREVIDADDYFTEKIGRTPAEVITSDGEKRFRELETEILREITVRSGVIICTGGGAVTVTENHGLLRQNGKVVFINRDLSLLATDGRPLSDGGRDKLKALYDARLPLYRAVCDLEIAVGDSSDVSETAKNIAKNLGY